MTRLPDYKRTDPLAVRAPAGLPVEGCPDSDLVRDLRSYLEAFLGYPFPSETDRPKHVRAALKSWGRNAFTTLFDARRGRSWYDAAIRDGLEQFDLRISSDDPRVLAWPWEALEDP